MTAAKLTATDVLINLISAFLTPMFLVASNGDLRLAEMAALQTIDAYRVQNKADIVTVAQIVAFGLATLGSLGLSMNDDLSLSMILRLRGNANACNRSAEQLRRALRESHEGPPAREFPSEDTPQGPPSEAPAQPHPAQPHPAQPHPARSMTPDQHRRAAWAAAFTEVAAEFTAELPNLPPDEQRAASIKADALNSSASALLSGADLSSYALNRLPKPTGV